MTVLFGALLVFLAMRVVVEPKLRPGREIWDRVLGLAPSDAAVLAGVRFVGTFSVFAGLGAHHRDRFDVVVESLDPASLGIEGSPEALARVESLVGHSGLAEQHSPGWGCSLASSTSCCLWRGCFIGPSVRRATYGRVSKPTSRDSRN